MRIQLLVPAAVPPPLPNASAAISSTSPSAYAGCAPHSSHPTGMRRMRGTMSSASENHSSCCRHVPSARVPGTSTFPALKIMAMPKIARATTSQKRTGSPSRTGR